MYLIVFEAKVLRIVGAVDVLPDVVLRVECIRPSLLTRHSWCSGNRERTTQCSSCITSNVARYPDPSEKATDVRLIERRSSAETLISASETQLAHHIPTERAVGWILELTFVQMFPSLVNFRCWCCYVDAGGIKRSSECLGFVFYCAGCRS